METECAKFAPVGSKEQKEGVRIMRLFVECANVNDIKGGEFAAACLHLFVKTHIKSGLGKEVLFKHVEMVWESENESV